MTRTYPDEAIDGFPAPPLAFTDQEGREIAVRSVEGEGGRSNPARRDDAIEALVEMYIAFDPADRAQGIPPVGEAAIREWLATIVTPDGVNVVGWHGEDAVGHATLVPDGQGAFELAIFVQDAYQEAGIGTQLIEALLGEGRRREIERVWLTVEPWNQAAYRLYEKVGFERATMEGFEVEMAARLQ